LITSLSKPRVAISYTTDDKGILTLNAEGHHPKTGTALRVELRPDPEDTDDHPTRGQATADETGKALVQMKKAVANPHGTLRVLWQWSTDEGKSPSSLTIPLLPQKKDDRPQLNPK